MSNFQENDGTSKKKQKTKWVPLDNKIPKSVNPANRPTLNSATIGNVWNTKKGSDLFSKSSINLENVCKHGVIKPDITTAKKKEDEDTLMVEVLKESLKTHRKEQEERRLSKTIIGIATLEEDEILGDNSCCKSKHYKILKKEKKMVNFKINEFVNGYSAKKQATFYDKNNFDFDSEDFQLNTMIFSNRKKRGGNGQKETLSESNIKDVRYTGMLKNSSNLGQNEFSLNLEKVCCNNNFSESDRLQVDVTIPNTNKQETENSKYSNYFSSFDSSSATCNFMETSKVIETEGYASVNNDNYIIDKFTQHEDAKDTLSQSPLNVNKKISNLGNDFIDGKNSKISFDPQVMNSTTNYETISSSGLVNNTINSIWSPVVPISIDDNTPTLSSYPIERIKDSLSNNFSNLKIDSSINVSLDDNSWTSEVEPQIINKKEDEIVNYFRHVSLSEVQINNTNKYNYVEPPPGFPSLSSPSIIDYQSNSNKVEHIDQYKRNDIKTLVQQVITKYPNLEYLIKNFDCNNDDKTGNCLSLEKNEILPNFNFEENNAYQKMNSKCNNLHEKSNSSLYSSNSFLSSQENLNHTGMCKEVLLQNDPAILQTKPSKVLFDSSQPNSEVPNPSNMCSENLKVSSVHQQVDELSLLLLQNLRSQQISENLQNVFPDNRTSHLNLLDNKLEYISKPKILEGLAQNQEPLLQTTNALSQEKVLLSTPFYPDNKNGNIFDRQSVPSNPTSKRFVYSKENSGHQDSYRFYQPIIDKYMIYNRDLNQVMAQNLQANQTLINPESVPFVVDEKLLVDHQQHLLEHQRVGLSNVKNVKFLNNQESNYECLKPELMNARSRNSTSVVIQSSGITNQPRMNTKISSEYFEHSLIKRGYQNVSSPQDYPLYLVPRPYYYQPISASNQNQITNENSNETLRNEALENNNTLVEQKLNYKELNNNWSSDGNKAFSIYNCQNGLTDQLYESQQTFAYHQQPYYSANSYDGNVTYSSKQSEPDLSISYSINGPGQFVHDGISPLKSGYVSNVPSYCNGYPEINGFISKEPGHYN